MSLVEIRVEKGSSGAGFPNTSGMTEAVAPSRTVDRVGHGEKPQMRAGLRQGNIQKIIDLLLSSLPA